MGSAQFCAQKKKKKKNENKRVFSLINTTYEVGTGLSVPYRLLTNLLVCT
jgi:hypothetical protein